MMLVQALSHHGLLLGGFIVLAIVLIAIFAPHDPYEQILSRKLVPPVWFDSPKASWDHLLGTDHLGREYLSRLIYGARISLMIGFSAMLISGVIGTILGVCAGCFRDVTGVLVGDCFVFPWSWRAAT